MAVRTVMILSLSGMLLASGALWVRSSSQQAEHVRQLRRLGFDVWYPSTPQHPQDSESQSIMLPMVAVIPVDFYEAPSHVSLSTPHVPNAQEMQMACETINRLGSVKEIDLFSSDLQLYHFQEVAKLGSIEHLGMHVPELQKASCLRELSRMQTLKYLILFFDEKSVSHNNGDTQNADYPQHPVPEDPSIYSCFESHPKLKYLSIFGSALSETDAVSISRIAPLALLRVENDQFSEKSRKLLEGVLP